MWPESVTPKNPAAADTNRVKLGVRFTPSRDGLVKRIQFYRDAMNPGPHVGELYAAGGTRLARVSFPTAK